MTVMTDHNRQLLAEKCRRSLPEFVKTFWSIVEPGTPLIWNWHIEAICYHLQAVTYGEFNKVIICVPPGFMKSLLVSVFWQAWEWTFHPTVRSMFGSYDESLTHRDSIKCRDIIKSKRYNTLFGPRWDIRRDQDSKGYFSNTLHGSRKTFFVGSQNITGWRGDRIVIDDPLSAKKRYDRNAKREVIDVWDRVLSTRVNDPRTASFVIIMQRLAEDDLVGHILKTDDGKYIKLILPNEFDPKRRCVTPIFADPRTMEGELLFPQVYNAEATAEKRRVLGEIDYEAQFQHNPFPEAGARFNSSHFLFWKHVSSNIIKLIHSDGREELVRVDLLPKFITVDVACSEKRQADSTSIGLFATTSSGNMILLDRISVQANEGDVVNSIVSMYRSKRFGNIPPMWVGIESNGVGLPISQNAQAKGVPVCPIHVSQDKITSSATAVIRFQCGQIFIPDYSEATWVSDFVNQLVAFPGGDHDDDVTMISLAANSIFESQIGVIGSGSMASVPIVGQSQPGMKIEINQEKRRRFGLRS